MVQTVFTNDMVAHVWAQQNQDHGRSGNGQFFFEKTAIYSYRHGYPVGNFVTNKRGEVAVLLWDGKYSITTSRHQSHASRAVRHKTCFIVPDLMVTGYSPCTGDDRHKRNVKTMTDTLKAEVDNCLKASKNINMNSRMYTLGAYGVVTRHQRIVDYCKFFGLYIPAYLKAFDTDDLRAEYEQNERDAIAARDLKAQKLLDRLGSIEAVTAHNERRHLMTRAGAFTKRHSGLIMSYLESGRYVHFLDREDFVTLHRDLEAFVADNPTDTTMVRHATRYATTFEAVRVEVERADREKAERERLAAIQEKAALAEWQGMTREEKFSYISGHTHKVYWLTDGERLSAWREGYRIPLPRTSVMGPNYAIMRLSADGQQIETSQDARFPLDHGKRAWALLKAIYSRGDAWHSNGKTIKLGHFQIDRVDASGTVFAGCHTVERSEVEHMARLLGLETIDTLPLKLTSEA